MPSFVLIARDHPNGLESRKTHQPAHREHMAKLDVLLKIGRAILAERNDRKLNYS